MGKDELHDIAQSDTPSAIEVPKTWQGLIVWAVARFGVGILVAAVFGYATTIVYADMRADRAELFRAYLQNAEVMQSMTTAIRRNTEAIEQFVRDTAPPP